MENKAGEIKTKIMSFLRFRGPSLPVHVAKEANLSLLFASAFLSELLSEKEIKISNMRIGGSPLYFVPGQEHMLERFSNSINGKEKEALLLLKEKGILREEELDPAIRVAVKSLRDFAFPLTVNLPNKQVTFWRYISFAEEEAKKRIEEVFEREKSKEQKKIEAEIKKEIAQEETKKQEEIKKEMSLIKEEITRQEPEKKEKKHKDIEEKIEKKKEELKKLEEIKIENEKPLLELKPEKKIPDSEFILKIREYLSGSDMKILEEIEKKKKDFVARVKINSDLGEIEFLCIAKDKKNINDSDLTLALEKARGLKKPAFFITNGELNKKGKEYLENWGNLIRFRKV